VPVRRSVKAALEYAKNAGESSHKGGYAKSQTGLGTLMVAHSTRFIHGNTHAQNVQEVWYFPTGIVDTERIGKKGCAVWLDRSADASRREERQCKHKNREEYSAGSRCETTERFLCSSGRTTQQASRWGRQPTSQPLNPSSSHPGRPTTPGRCLLSLVRHRAQRSATETTQRTTSCQ
jgi:hypothetical protein